MKLTEAELTILGLIVEQPRHGYDLEQIIEQRGIREWTDIGFSSIYYILTKLEKRSLVAADSARSGTRSRRVFRATEEGERAAASGTLTNIAVPRPVPHPFLVGLANLPLLTELAYDEALRNRLIEIEARIVSVTDAKNRQSPLPVSAREVFSYSLSLLAAERTWLAERVRIADE